MTQINTHQLRHLIDEHGAALMLYARQWCRAPEDVLQEALIELLRQVPAPRQPVAWLYKTVRCRAMNQARAEQRRAKHQRLAAEEREPWFVEDDETPWDSRELEPLLAALPELDREIVVARVWGELSFDQIAELTERSTSAVHRRYRQALARLRQMMSGKLGKSS